MLHGKPRTRTRVLLLIASLLMTASCASSESSSVVSAALAGRSSATPTEADRAEIQQAIQSATPAFPYPSLAALKALRDLNNPEVNQWVQDLTILCRQLDKECADAPR